MKRILRLLIYCLCTVLMAILLLPLKGSAASIVSGFPLPVTGNPYYVTVLNQYSDGGEHSSYINKYVLGKSTAPNDIVADIAASSGTSVYAVTGGTVITSTFSNGGGNYVVIKHNDGTYSYYGHLSSRSVAKGNTVSQGQTIGYVGMTGSATGYHLHFEWSGHDPYCEFAAKGYVQISSNSGASIHPHNHGTVTPVGGEITFSNMRAENVTTDDAKIIGTINNPSGSMVTRVWVIVEEEGTGDQWSFSENCGLTKTSFNMWYTLKSEWKELKDGTKYYYIFQAEVNGKWYSSGYYTFYTTDTISPQISDVRVENITSSGYDVSCVASDNKMVSKVQFPTWTSNNGQDDLIWHDAINQGGRYVFHVNTADHKNESGRYITHIYAWDSDGNSSNSEVEVDVPTPTIRAEKVNLISTPESQATAIISATVSPANATISSILWSSSNTNVAVVQKDPNNPLQARMIGLSTGNCTITVKINNGECSESIDVKVNIEDSDVESDELSTLQENSENKEVIKEDEDYKEDKPSLTIGDTTEVEGLIYLIKENDEVEVISDEGLTTNNLVIPDTIEVEKKTYIVTSIGKAAFRDNSYIVSAKIGNNITEINDEAFKNCKCLKKVIIGDGVTQIGRKTFNKCKKLKTIEIKSTYISKIGKRAFSGVAKKAKFRIPSWKMKKYKKLIKKAGAPKNAKYLSV